MKQIKILFFLVIAGFSNSVTARGLVMNRQALILDGKTDTLYSIQKDSICLGGYCMEVISKTIAGKPPENGKNHFLVTCIEQKLVFCFNDKKNAERMLPVKKIKTKLDTGEKRLILENEIIYIGVVTGLKDSLFAVIGDGGCNRCSELYALFSKTGQILYLDYFEGENMIYQEGDLDAVLEKAGISDEIFSRQEFRKKMIFKTL